MCIIPQQCSSSSALFSTKRWDGPAPDLGAAHSGPVAQCVQFLPGTLCVVGIGSEGCSLSCKKVGWVSPGARCSPFRPRYAMRAVGFRDAVCGRARTERVHFVLQKGGIGKPLPSVQPVPGPSLHACSWGPERCVLLGEGRKGALRVVAGPSITGTGHFR